MGAQHSTRASRARSRKPPSGKSRELARNARPNLSAILGRLSDVSGIFEVVCRSLEADRDDIESVSHARHPEAITLRHGLTLLAAVYTEFDEAIPAPTDAHLTALAKGSRMSRSRFLHVGGNDGRR